MDGWKDTTSYSRGDRERVPRSLELTAGQVSVVVTRWFHGEPGRWYLSCDPWHSYHLLVATDIGEAKREAVDLVSNLLRMSCDALAKHTPTVRS